MYCARLQGILKKRIYKKILLAKPKYKKFAGFSKLGNYGRLGNQLFQYAAIKSFSIKHSMPLLLPPVKEHRLHEFKIDSNYAPINNIEYAADLNYNEKQY